MSLARKMTTESIFGMAGEYSQLSKSIRCGNCYTLLGDNQRISKLVSGNDDLVNEVLVWDAIAYIYGLAFQDLRTISSHYSKHILNLKPGEEDVDNDVIICESCAAVLSDNYRSHKIFQTSTHPSSFIQQVKNFNTKESQTTKQICKEREELVDVQDISEEMRPSGVLKGKHKKQDGDDLFPNFNFGDDEGMPDFEEEMEEKYESVDVSNGESPEHSTSLLGMKELTVKLEKISEEDLEQQYGIKPTKINSNRKRKTLFKYRKNTTPRYSERQSKRKPNCDVDLGKNQLPDSKVKGEKSKYGSSKCKICGKTFRSSHYYKFCHLPTHNEDASRFLRCDICGKMLKGPVSFKCHMKITHANDEEKAKMKIACEICGKVVQSYNLTSHMQWKHANSSRETVKYSCEKCDKMYSNKTYFEAHLLTHSEGFTPFLCTLCGKTFESKFYLKKHEESHFKEKKIECHLCPSKCLNRTTLKIHLLTHSSERKFVCDQCGKSFKFPQHLNKHLKLHEELSTKGEYSVKCEECGKFFIHSPSLYKHTARFHRTDLKKNIYKCSYCEKVLSSRTVLQIHEKLHAKDPGYQPRKKQTWKDITHGKLKNAGVL